jgi:hypothetical protein
MRPKREAQLGLSATTFLLLCISFGPDRACFIIAIVLRALRSREGRPRAACGVAGRLDGRERETRGGDRRSNFREVSLKLSDLGVSERQSHFWRKLAGDLGDRPQPIKA